jgi:hypothetical protein
MPAARRATANFNAERSKAMQSADDAAAVSAVFFTRGSTRPSVRFHAKPFALEALGRYFNIFDAEAWRDTSEGARDRLLARLEAMAAAEDARKAAEEPDPSPARSVGEGAAHREAMGG